MSDYKELEVWKKGMGLVRDIYIVTKKFPRDEQYGITQQIRRSAVSIPSNIAEGSTRRSYLDFKRLLEIALGSASELETQIIISNDLGYIKDTEKFISQIQSIRMMLNKFISKLKES